MYCAHCPPTRDASASAFSARFSDWYNASHPASAAMCAREPLLAALALEGVVAAKELLAKRGEPDIAARGLGERPYLARARSVMSRWTANESRKPASAPT